MLPLAGDIAARFEAGSDRSVGDGRAQHPVDCEGGKEGSLMPTHRLSMCRIREVLRLRHQSLTERVIAQEQWRRACYVRRARLAGLIWPLPEGIDDGGLERLL